MDLMCCVKIHVSSAMKISDYIDDPVAYCKLTDNIFDLIRHMDQPSGEHGFAGESSTASQQSGSLDKKTRAIEEAIQTLNNIEKRKLYKFVGEAILDVKQMVRTFSTVSREKIKAISHNYASLYMYMYIPTCTTLYVSTCTCMYVQRNLYSALQEPH